MKNKNATQKELKRRELKQKAKQKNRITVLWLYASALHVGQA